MTQTLELRSQIITHYENGEPVYTEPKHEAYGTRKELLLKKKQLEETAAAEGTQIHVWTTPLPPSKLKQGAKTT